jgi:ABC-type phosphate transport system substrate-binding protein
MRSRTILRASLCVFLAACGLCLPVPRTRAQTRIAIVGSGSNVPINLYTAWTEEFNKKNSGITVRYLSMSTVEGIRQITEGSGDFAAGEIPLTDEQSGLLTPGNLRSRLMSGFRALASAVAPP